MHAIAACWACLAVQAAFMRQKMERHEVAVQKAAEERRAAEVGWGIQAADRPCIFCAVLQVLYPQRNGTCDTDSS